MVLWSVRASDSLELVENVDGFAWGVLSMVAIIRDVVLSTESGKRIQSVLSVMLGTRTW